MRIHFIQHLPVETPPYMFNIIKWAENRLCKLTGTLIYRGHDLPEADSLDGLIIMGGSMSAYEEDKYPWMSYEKQWIQEVMESGKPVLGICLGAQLLADVMGAKVFPNKYREIGWFPITLRPDIRDLAPFDSWPATFTVFHWHGDTFSLPEGAIPLASSEATVNQGFLYENLLALQFHLELTKEQIGRFLHSFKDEMQPGPYVQHDQTIQELSEQHEKETVTRLKQVLDSCFMK